MDDTKETIMSDAYYDISVRACGFLNRLQEIKPENGKPFLTCRFAALRGAKSERATPTYFDLIVVGEKAKALLAKSENVINSKSRNVFASVRLSDVFVQAFTRKKGEHEGETGYALKSRLLVIESLAIDGVIIYRRADDPTEAKNRSRNRTEPPAASRASRAVS